MTDDSIWLGYHALDGENEEWTHFEIWRAGNDFYWNYFDESSGETGLENGPFDTAKEAYDDANA